MSVIDKLVRGSIDMHLHHGPEARSGRWYDALELAAEAQKAGLRAIVLKHNHFSTAPLAYFANKVARHIAVFGSITLNYEVGGLNPAAVKIAGEMGAKVVWMPTMSAASFRQKIGPETAERLGLEGPGLVILDDNGQVLPVVGEIIEIAKKHDMILATGHLDFVESLAVVKEARRRGLAKVVATHVNMGFSIEQQQQLAEAGAINEYCFILTLPRVAQSDMKSVAHGIKEVGVERCFLSTDLGSDWAPPPQEGLRTAIAALLEHGLSEEEVEILVKKNPAKLLDLN